MPLRNFNSFSPFPLRGLERYMRRHGVCCDNNDSPCPDNSQLRSICDIINNNCKCSGGEMRRFFRQCLDSNLKNFRK